MSGDRTYRELAGVNWRPREPDTSHDAIALGCMLKIADAADKVANNIVALMRERDELRDRVLGLTRERTSLRAKVTKLTRELDRQKAPATTEANT